MSETLKSFSPSQMKCEQCPANGNICKGEQGFDCGAFLVKLSSLLEDQWLAGFNNDNLEKELPRAEEYVYVARQPERTGPF